MRIYFFPLLIASPAKLLMLGGHQLLALARHADLFLLPVITEIILLL